MHEDLGINDAAAVRRGRPIQPTFTEKRVESRPVEDLTTERGSEYGHPLDHFTLESTLYEAWRDARIRALTSGEVATLPTDLERSLDHAVRWVLDKLTRAVRSPTKVDHWDDIAGYARTFVMAMDELVRRDQQTKRQERP